MSKPIRILCQCLALVLCAVTVNAQVVANFTLSDTAGCASMIVYFTNTSTGATSYTWDLGNGTTSTLSSVSGSYITGGTYTVRLTASNGSTSSTHTATINVYGAPTVSFHASDTAICPGTSITFTNTSIAGSPGPVTLSWNFGDGSGSSSPSPSYSYSTSGDYNTTLFVTNSKGCMSSLSKDPYIHVYTPPSPGFSAVDPYLCHAPGTATFVNSTIGIGPITYQWRFGDGGTSAFTSPGHTYLSAGTYGVSLIATDANGCEDSLSLPSYIAVGGLSASFTPVAHGCTNIPVTFINTSTSHISSTWYFGDGASSSSEDGVHTYTASGSYTVRLVAYDGTCFDTAVSTVVISHPTGTISITPLQPCPPPTTLTFAASVPSGCTVSWSSLIYGSLGTGTTISHLFMPYGTLQSGIIDSITMFITDSYGCKDTVGRPDTINKLVVNIAPSIVNGCSPVTGVFSVAPNSVVYDRFADAPYYRFGIPPVPGVESAIGYPYPYGISSYSWNFGDGSPVSTAPAPTHIYTLVGAQYDVALKVTSVNGCTDSVKADSMVMVGSKPPTPSFTRTPSKECSGQRVYFTSSALDTFDSYLWDCGDGSADSVANPVHVYTVPGIFNVELRTSYNGCHSDPYDLRDTAIAPNAAIAETFLCSPRSRVLFSDSSVGDDTHLWQFGDGTTSTASDVVHTYPSASTYTVQLTTYNAASGCRDTMQILLKLAQLNATLIPYSHPASICRDVPDSFAATSVAMPGDSSWVTCYRWYFDGILSDSIAWRYFTDTAAHTFSATGTNRIMLLLTDNHNCNDTLTTSVLVAKPADSFSFTPTGGCAPLTVNFTDHTVPTPGTSLVSYSWSFGDGHSSSGAPVTSNTYLGNGTYHAQEIVVDNIGCIDTFVDSTPVLINKPSASFHASLSSVCAHANVVFTNTSTGGISSKWFFGDGDTSNVTSPTHAYRASGTYTVKLVVAGLSGCTDTMTVPNYITVKPSPVASFTMSDSFSVCHPFSVTFADSSTGATTYYWTFGDGVISTAPAPTEVYVAPGYYRVKLQVYNIYGCSDTVSHHVNIFGYSGAFTYTPTGGCPPLPVHFTGTFSSVARVVWDFADGVTSASSSDTITHIYNGIGSFLPKLILTDSSNCTAASVGSDTIRLGIVNAGFTFTPSPVCEGNLLTFHDTSSGGGLPVTSRLWTFAPGVTSALASPTHTYSVAGVYPVSLTVTNSTGCSGTVTRNVVVNSVPPPIHGPSVVCIGTMDAFTDSVGGGVWSSGTPAIASVGSSSGMVTGASLGTAAITYSLGSGCTMTKPVTVSAISSAISGLAFVCVGSVVTLTDTTLGGTWSTSSSAIATVGSAGIVTGISSGVDTVVYSVGVCPARKIMTVNNAPAISGPANICMTTTGTFTATPAGGTWTSSDPSIASIGSISGVVSGIVYGTVHITYTLPGTGCSTVASLLVNRPPGPELGSSLICVGGSTTLADSLSGGIWSSSNPAVATVGSLSGTVTAHAVGAASIVYNVGGCNVSKVVRVVTAPPVINGPAQACLGTSITLSDSLTAGTWTSSNPLIATVGSSSGVVTGVAIGGATISYSLGGGCTITKPVSIAPFPSAIVGNTNICLNDAETLRDTTAGGTWSSGDSAIVSVTSGGIVRALAPGAVNISYTLPAGCGTSFLVSVNAVPPVTGLHDMCAWGDHIVIHDSDVSGSYSATSVTVINIGSGFGGVTANAPGPATVTYTTPTGCAVSDTIMVYTLPTAISGTVNICRGSATTLSDLTPGGTWSASGTGIVSIDSASGIVRGLLTGSSHISYTLPTGCRADTVVNVFIFPVADTILGPSVLCVGQSISLADTAPGGAWSSTTTRARVVGGIVTALASGVDIIEYSVSNICGTAVAAKSITIYPAANAGIIVGSDSVCVGSTVTLTDTVAGGIWSSGSRHATVSVTGLVTGVSQGIDTIFYAVVNPSCAAKTKHAVFVNPKPDAGKISGNGNACVGDSVLLTESASGGLWSHIGGIATLVSGGSSVEYIPTSVGIDTIYYTVSNSCGGTVTKQSMAINALPVVDAITGSSVLCVGQSTILSDATPGGVWASTVTTAAVIDSNRLRLTAFSAGLDTISYMLSNSCGTVTRVFPVTVNPLPIAGSIVGNRTLCVDDSTSLTDAVPGGVWALSNNAATIHGSVVVSAVSGGEDTLSYSVTNSCGTAVATQVLTIDTVPGNIIIKVLGRALSVPAGYTSYQWIKDGTVIQGATSNSFTAGGPGVYSVIVGNNLGCVNNSATVTIPECTVSDIQVYPNPASSVVYILWCNTITARLTTLDGKLINVTENTSEIDVSFLPNGVYTLTLYDSKGQKLVTKRITKLAP